MRQSAPSQAIKITRDIGPYQRVRERAGSVPNDVARTRAIAPPLPLTGIAPPLTLRAPPSPLEETLKRRARLLLLAPIVILLVAPVPANAGTAGGKATHAGTSIVYSANPGEANDVTITGSGGIYTLHDTAGVTAGTNCAQTDVLTATCIAPPGGFQSVIVHTADQADTIHVQTDIPAVLNGGPGNDALYGGSESDTLVGGTGADVLSGGGGTDTADYSSRTNAVNVSIDGLANDGEAAEGDNVLTDVEQIWGGTGNDTLRGSPAANFISGGGGSDTISGLGGNDILIAGSGGSTVSGGGGADTLYGVSLNDHLSGGGGNDSITSGGGTDVLSGGRGNDSLFSQDDGVADRDMCGPGTDTANADTIDVVSADCETVTTT